MRFLDLYLKLFNRRRFTMMHPEFYAQRIEAVVEDGRDRSWWSWDELYDLILDEAIRHGFDYPHRVAERLTALLY